MHESASVTSAHGMSSCTDPSMHVQSRYMRNPTSIHIEDLLAPEACTNKTGSWVARHRHDMNTYNYPKPRTPQMYNVPNPLIPTAYICTRIYLHIYICIYVYMYICIYIYIYKHIHIFPCLLWNSSHMSRQQAWLDRPLPSAMATLINGSLATNAHASGFQQWLCHAHDCK